MTPSDPRAWAEQWAADWNRRDAAAVLAHFTGDAVFTSPRAAAVTGNGRVEGKPAIAVYWASALASVQSIHFVIDYVLTDAARLAILYTAAIDGKSIRVAEIFTFNQSGLICEGEVLHGAMLS